jgi:hypothetical protein
VSYPEPRRVVLSLADLRRLTILERARACAIAGVAERDLRRLVEIVTRGSGSPEDVELGAVLFYAIALQLERRHDPGLTWETAQTWDVGLDLDGPEDPVAEAEARAGVEAAAATGLPPDVAGALTLAQLDAYGALAERRERANGKSSRRSKTARARARR